MSIIILSGKVIFRLMTANIIPGIILSGIWLIAHIINRRYQSNNPGVLSRTWELFLGILAVVVSLIVFIIVLFFATSEAGRFLSYCNSDGISLFECWKIIPDYQKTSALVLFAMLIYLFVAFLNGYAVLIHSRMAVILIHLIVLPLFLFLGLEYQFSIIVEVVDDCCTITDFLKEYTEANVIAVAMLSVVISILKLILYLRKRSNVLAKDISILKLKIPVYIIIVIVSIPVVLLFAKIMKFEDRSTKQEYKEKNVDIDYVRKENSQETSVGKKTNMDIDDNSSQKYDKTNDTHAAMEDLQQTVENRTLPDDFDFREYFNYSEGNSYVYAGPTEFGLTETVLKVRKYNEENHVLIEVLSDGEGMCHYWIRIIGCDYSDSLFFWSTDSESYDKTYVDEKFYITQTDDSKLCTDGFVERHFITGIFDTFKIDRENSDIQEYLQKEINLRNMSVLHCNKDVLKAIMVKDESKFATTYVKNLGKYSTEIYLKDSEKYAFFGSKVLSYIVDPGQKIRKVYGRHPSTSDKNLDNCTGEYSIVDDRLKYTEN
ncbi:MAG: hypothetical protein JXB48_24480 [Candidatus Latescibacteria bacterium]|nr:hypothetical protein [Candidatus Latescibacterota bacterium]